MAPRDISKKAKTEKDNQYLMGDDLNVAPLENIQDSEELFRKDANSFLDAMGVDGSNNAQLPVDVMGTADQQQVMRALKAANLRAQAQQMAAAKAAMQAAGMPESSGDMDIAALGARPLSSKTTSKQPASSSQRPGSIDEFAKMVGLDTSAQMPMPMHLQNSRGIQHGGMGSLGSMTMPAAVSNLQLAQRQGSAIPQSMNSVGKLPPGSHPNFDGIMSADDYALMMPKVENSPVGSQTMPVPRSIGRSKSAGNVLNPWANGMESQGIQRRRSVKKSSTKSRDVTPEELAFQRARNRSHSRKARLKKKFYVEGLEQEVKAMKVYEKICQEVLDMIFVLKMDPFGQFSFVSPAFTRALGWKVPTENVFSKENELGSLFDVVHKDDRSQVQEALSKMGSSMFGNLEGLRFRLLNREKLCYCYVKVSARYVDHDIYCVARLDNTDEAK